MNIKSLNIGEKSCRFPIIQGGMGIGVSLSSLAAAVANEGGVGIISAAQIGFRDPLFESNPLEANLRAVETEFKKAREKTQEGILGFNIMVAMQHYKEYVTRAATAGADLIISGAGLPLELPAYVKGFKTKVAPIVSSDRAAKVILKYWDKKFQSTADLLVIEGPKAGGHLGFTYEEADSITDAEYESSILSVIDVVKEYENKYEQKIPVVVAGGIDCKEKVQRVLDLGADGVQVASLFVPTEECDVHENFKKAYVNAKKEDIIITKSPVGMPGRAICNGLTEMVENGKKEEIKKCYGCLKNCKPSEIPYCITGALIKSAKGDVDGGLVFCGANVDKINKISTVREVIEKLFL